MFCSHINYCLTILRSALKWSPGSHINYCLTRIAFYKWSPFLKPTISGSMSPTAQYQNSGYDDTLFMEVLCRIMVAPQRQVQTRRLDSMARKGHVATIHPNICAVQQMDEANGTNFQVEISQQTGSFITVLFPFFKQKSRSIYLNLGTAWNPKSGIHLFQLYLRKLEAICKGHAQLKKLSELHSLVSHAKKWSVKGKWQPTRDGTKKNEGREWIG